jgi:hypothetical protein
MIVPGTPGLNCRRQCGQTESQSRKNESRGPNSSALSVRDVAAAAWQHADGKGFNILIETVPLGGRISLRTPFQERE